MRRALLSALLAVPGLALGQSVPATAGVLDTLPEFINIEACNSSSETIGASWKIVPTVTFATDGTYRIYASNKAPPSSGDNAHFCPESDNTNEGTFARQIGQSFDAPQVSYSQRQLKAQDLMVAAGLSTACTQTSDVVINVCAHWYTSANSRGGYASGTVTLQLTRPATPVINSVTGGNHKLHVSLSAGPSGAAETTKYRVTVAPVNPADDTATHGAVESTSPVVVSGLLNDVQYTVTAYALSVAANPSEAAATGTGTPVPVDDFWDHYGNAGGAEQGGCSAGSGGLLALLAPLAALILLRRRNA
ncbi:MAG: fibronectin type III domain-containing protein [Anaeromyxobacter sp.]